MTRDNQGFLGALVIFGLLIVGVWFVRRPDHAKPNPDPPVESRTVHEGWKEGTQ